MAAEDHKGSSAEILRASRDGQFELVISENLLAELERTLAYPKLRKRIRAEKAAAFLSWVRAHGRLAVAPASPPRVSSRDPDDDYLLALAIDRRAYLVTGDARRVSSFGAPARLVAQRDSRSFVANESDHASRAAQRSSSAWRQSNPRESAAATGKAIVGHVPARPHGDGADGYRSIRT